jgi:glyoxylase-like metal-dependent hydrolase (beta-lactamase superfamily II)
MDALEFSINILLINTSQHLVLVDTGLGSAAGGNLPETLRSQGIDPQAVTTVIITHGHGDHLGGITGSDGALAFPNARAWMPKADWDFYTSETYLATLGEASGSAVHRYLFPLQKHILLFEGETEIVPGICVIPAPGHTDGHAAVEVAAGGEKLLHMADAMHHPFQLGHLGWSPTFDRQPAVASDTRRRLVARAASERMLVMAYHFPFPGLGRVWEQGGGWAWRSIGNT